MKTTKVLSAVFAGVAACAAAAAVCLSFTSLNASPVLLSPPDEAEAQVTAMMDAVCQADYDRASEYLYGTPALGVDREAADEVGALLWDAYTDSISYELVGDCYATDNGLAQNVKITSLDVTTVTAVLRERSQTLLEERVAEAKDTKEIYDEDNEYREEFVMDVLYDAAEEALEQDASEMTVALTLNLTYQDGQWWIVADNELLDAISGGILY